ncbi:hypothetical protein ACFFRR_009031 [Megaselia abdita]
MKIALLWISIALLANVALLTRADESTAPTETPKPAEGESVTTKAAEGEPETTTAEGETTKAAEGESETTKAAEGESVTTKAAEGESVTTKAAEGESVTTKAAEGESVTTKAPEPTESPELIKANEDLKQAEENNADCEAKYEESKKEDKEACEAYDKCMQLFGTYLKCLDQHIKKCEVRKYYGICINNVSESRGMLSSCRRKRDALMKQH